MRQLSIYLQSNSILFKGLVCWTGCQSRRICSPRKIPCGFSLWNELQSRYVIQNMEGFLLAELLLIRGLIVDQLYDPEFLTIKILLRMRPYGCIASL